jgi:dipeptidase E
MTDPTRTGQIVAMGGGGFLMEPNNTLLDDFVLSLSRRQPARVCFVPTARADSASCVARFYRAFAGRSIPTDVTLFDTTALPRHPAQTGDLMGLLADQDVIYVSGGNTANLLAMWRAHGIDSILRAVWLKGAVLAGVSAGMLCWFRGGVTDSFGSLAALNDGLGLIDATACPHYDGEVERRPTYHRLVSGGLPGGFAADDGAALHFRGPELVEVVSSRPGAGAYRVDCMQGRVVESPLGVRFLGAG